MKNLSDPAKTKSTLEAGFDYPRTYREFVEWFRDEEPCLAYLEKFTFRFNRRTNRRTSLSRGLVFRRLLEQAVITGPIMETEMAHNLEDKHHNM